MLGLADTSTITRRHLARQLRQLRREQARLSLDEVTRKLRWTPNKIEDLEHAETPPHPQDVAALCGLYGADADMTASLVAIATHTQHSLFWQTHHTPDPQAMSIYPQLLEHAEHIYEYQPIQVPTLLQTQAYARIQLADTTGDPDTLDQRVAARLDEARLLTRADPAPPQLTAVLDEAVLRQLPDRPDIMAEQLHHLANLARLPNVRIRIVPFTAGAHPGLLMTSGFTILDFPDHHDPAPLHPPRFTDDGHPDTPTDTQQYRAAFNDLLNLTLNQYDTRQLLLQTAERHQR